MRILKADRAYLTTTLDLLRKHHACNTPKPGRYDHLVGALGPGWDDMEPIGLLTILGHNGVDDMLWALRATQQNCCRVACLLAADFAEAALPLWGERQRRRTQEQQEITAARRLAQSKATDGESADGGAAVRAAYVASRDARYLAGCTAGEAARVATAGDVRGGIAAGDAAWAAADAAAWAAHAAIIRKYLLEKP